MCKFYWGSATLPRKCPQCTTTTPLDLHSKWGGHYGFGLKYVILESDESMQIPIAHLSGATLSSNVAAQKNGVADYLVFINSPDVLDS